MLNLLNERETLLRVADILTGEMRDHFDMLYVIGSKYPYSREIDDPPEDFSILECGSVACIGGHAWLLENPGSYHLAREYVLGVSDISRIYFLYYPDVDDWGDITVEDAVQAIENYLNEEYSEDDIWQHVRERQNRK